MGVVFLKWDLFHVSARLINVFMAMGWVALGWFLGDNADNETRLVMFPTLIFFST